MKRPFTLFAGALLVLGAASANAQSTGTQTFTATVDPVLTITAPAAATLTLTNVDTSQAFAAQRWAVAQNNATGANVGFAVSQPFTNGTYKRDAKLDLTLFSSDTGAGWSVTKATDTTAYGAVTPDNAADVTANATGAGNASFDLTVTFVTVDYSTLAGGNYVTTVTGTLAANP